jgi:threonine synthase
VAVENAEILAALRMLAAREGAFVCPEGTVTLAAAIRLARDGWISPEERVVLLNTGTGLKYPETVETDPPVLQQRTTCARSATIPAGSTVCE